MHAASDTELVQAPRVIAQLAHLSSCRPFDATRSSSFVKGLQFGRFELPLGLNNLIFHHVGSSEFASIRLLRSSLLTRRYPGP